MHKMYYYIFWINNFTIGFELLIWNPVQSGRLDSPNTPVLRLVRIIEVELYRDIINDKNWVCSSKRSQIQTWNNFKTARKLINFSFATLTVTYEPRVALRPLPKQNGASRRMAWIGEVRHIPRSLRPPDLISCDIYIWEYVEDQVYQPPTPQSLREQISHESQLRHTWEELECRIHVCRVTNGEHIAHV
jgi:hypothetical protein